MKSFSDTKVPSKLIAASGAALEEITAAVKQSAENARQANSLAIAGAEQAWGMEHVDRAVSQMAQVVQSSSFAPPVQHGSSAPKASNGSSGAHIFDESRR